jgi:cell division transport system permease protein
VSTAKMKQKPRRRRGINAVRARRSADGPGNWLQAYIDLHVETLKSSFLRLRRTPVASIMTVLVIAISLTIPASFHVFVKNARQASSTLEATNQISLFLKPDLSDKIGAKVAETLKNHTQIATAELITKEAGLQELKSYSGFGDALKALDFNPLPAVISIRPKDSLTRPDDVEKLLAELRSLPEADFVQLDTEWMRKLHSILTIAQRSTVVFSALLSLGVLFIVGNTIRLELQNRREEIVVAKLIGATDRFIRRPFLYAGFWYGFLGGTLAWLLVSAFLLFLRGPSRQLAELYGSPYTLAFLDLSETELLIGTSVLLGIIGAWIVVSYHLRELDPT